MNWRAPAIFIMALIHLPGMTGAGEAALWSFAPPPAEHRIPEVTHPGWESVIDRYIAESLTRQGMKPSGKAAPEVLIRRLYATLIGLPPSVDSLHSFLSGQEDSVVDQLLESEHFGERWGRHWLDVARFGESDGVLAVYSDRVRKDAWKFRDAVIHAFNQDLPFDQFVRYQLGGNKADIPEPYSALKQFIHLGTRLQDNADPNDRQFHRLDDMISTTGNAFLGYTLGCARCHDHPVDPITTREYYQMSAIFFDQFKESPKASAKKVELVIKEPRVLNKGRWSSPGDPVSPGYIRGWMQSSPEHWNQPGVTKMEALGHWITDTELGAGMQLARVTVNRVWHHVFGRGLVASPNDFGNLGAPPSHPELLDWLATQLIHHQWRLKPIIRMIVTSRTFQQSSKSTQDNLALDADNVWLWHFRPYRLEAEAIRDYHLAISDSLNLKPYGPSIPIGDYKNPSKDSQKTWRRSVYLQAHRTTRHPTLCLFDLPVSQVSVGARTTSATAEGALFSLNSPFVWAMARNLALRIDRETEDMNTTSRIHHIYLTALSRHPSAQEIAIGLDLLADDNAESLKKYCHLVLGLNEFIYIN